MRWVYNDSERSEESLPKATRSEDSKKSEKSMTEVTRSE
jgi:hypothetical protein